ncbi:hypothetical protein SLEP1_g50082 [Rubroshorea leprosula]|uniref:Uncharacterized protein n=1 Tax=Rubroshorea leprosula TaxID=152421 RepID=A0AAV5LZS2_9ROSI|nr:hypothetical protein SLEP1_g50082 [Rubroshorea leprosula]
MGPILVEYRMGEYRMAIFMHSFVEYRMGIFMHGDFLHIWCLHKNPNQVLTNNPDWVLKKNPQVLLVRIRSRFSHFKLRHLSDSLFFRFFGFSGLGFCGYDDGGEGRVGDGGDDERQGGGGVVGQAEAGIGGVTGSEICGGEPSYGIVVATHDWGNRT